MYQTIAVLMVIVAYRGGTVIIPGWSSLEACNAEVKRIEEFYRYTNEDYRCVVVK